MRLGCVTTTRPATTLGDRGWDQGRLAGARRCLDHRDSASAKRLGESGQARGDREVGRRGEQVAQRVGHSCSVPDAHLRTRLRDTPLRACARCPCVDVARRDAQYLVEAFAAREPPSVVDAENDPSHGLAGHEVAHRLRRLAQGKVRSTTTRSWLALHETAQAWPSAPACPVTRTTRRAAGGTPQSVPRVRGGAGCCRASGVPSPRMRRARSGCSCLAGPVRGGSPGRSGCRARRR